MKKINLLWIIGIMAIVYAFSVSAASSVFNSSCRYVQNSSLNSVTNISINYPCNNDFTSTTSSVLYLNATVSTNGATYINITNVTFIFTGGGNELRFTNNTVNGSVTTPSIGDFVVNVSSSVFAGVRWTMVVQVMNTTDTGSTTCCVNSSSITFGSDQAPPSVTLNEPYQGSTIVPNNDVINFKYTPADSNFGNCTLMLNNQVVSSSTTGTTASNFSSGTQQQFSYVFRSDNNSIRYVVECLDLAGNRGDSSNITFNVLRGAISPAVRQLQIAEAAGQAQSISAGSSNANNIAGGLAVAQSSVQNAVVGFDIQTHLQNYGWMYVGGIIIIGALYAFRKKF